MIEQGYTECFALPAYERKLDESIDDYFDNFEGGFTWSTKQPGGFKEKQREVLRRTVGALATLVRGLLNQLTSKTLLQIYLGQDAGARVFNGEIERGDGLVIRSVVWFSDIRGFTSMSNQLVCRDVIGVINEVFEMTDEIVRKYNGQVLKYMGDGCMAIFAGSTQSFQRDSFSSVEKRELDHEHAAKLCHRARLAAAELQSRLATWTTEREGQGLRGATVGIGLHYGDVNYGNVGARARMDFTVIGRAVNLASRVEGLSSKLNAKVLASRDFVDLDVEPEVWISRGEHHVKGLPDPVTVYELNKMDEDTVRRSYDATKSFYK